MQPAKHSMSGFSLLEVVVASALSLMVLSLLVHLLMAGQRAAVGRATQLMLAQDVQDAWRMLTTDLRRAGYQVQVDEPLRLNGALHTVHVTAAQCVVMQYELSDGAVVKAYYLEDGEFRVRSSSTAFSSPEQACHGGQALLDSRWMTITDWQVATKSWSQERHTGQLLQFSLTVQALDGSVSHQESMSLSLRNPS
ncbi:hypothetical protein [Photobacterium galatheae]|uniref:Prepilin-type N-terminal cleavage/methylation domain-containing protein n=1 Tax=Photobacterium galatheae TaxID=1654360 RepID=A0A066RN54_9GAMM|nr:hypothetical protein [Photobacterium galatheae]KDM91885.1 hypothetical protein EA58_09150 [Photobacterium galatheae]MCM0147702.1 hypothetical protein [Photobacterium galatheae]